MVQPIFKLAAIIFYIYEAPFFKKHINQQINLGEFLWKLEIFF